MTIPTNWPNPERPGVPMFPEKDGEHVFFSPFEGSFLVIFWEAATERYLRNGKEFSVDTIQDSAIGYHGPCLTPAQIAEMLAAERERAATVCEDNTVSMQDENIAAAINEILETTASEIRNLGAAP